MSIGAYILFGKIKIIVCNSEKITEQGKTKQTPVHINNSSLAFPWQPVSKKQFNLSRVISGAAIVAEVWSHMLTHVVSEWARGLGKDIWMNIDISLAPCGVSAGGMRACETLKNGCRQSLKYVFFFFSSFPTECSTVLSFFQQWSK